MMGGLVERRGVEGGGGETAMYVGEGLGVQQGDWGALCFISGLSRTIHFDGYYLRRRNFKSFVMTSINLAHHVPNEPDLSHAPWGPDLSHALWGPDLSHAPWGPDLSHAPSGPHVSHAPWG